MCGLGKRCVRRIIGKHFWKPRRLVVHGLARTLKIKLEQRFFAQHSLQDALYLLTKWRREKAREHCCGALNLSEVCIAEVVQGQLLDLNVAGLGQKSIAFLRQCILENRHVRQRRRTSNFIITDADETFLHQAVDQARDPPRKTRLPLLVHQCPQRPKFRFV